MAELGKYIEKRDFEKTPEPTGGSANGTAKNRFVIQRHLARREHFDFRLQIGNILASWAIPKEPSYDTDKKRLAVKTEDHPLDYIHFEGNIPKGNYGAGNVMVWDLGYYYLYGSRTAPTAQQMHQQLASGSLKIHLQGAKLKGLFNLVKIQKSEKDEWLFMKAKEDEKEPHYHNRSALTGKSMEQIKLGENTWNSEKKQTEKIVKEKSRAVKKDFPGFISPMLATPVPEPFSGSDWIFEWKLDGYRIIASKNDGETALYSRNEHSFTNVYQGITRELSKIPAQFVIDGEVCYIDSSKKPNFQKLQNEGDKEEYIHYYVFDLLWLNGFETMQLPVTERKKILKELLKGTSNHIHYLPHIVAKGEAFFEEIVQKQLEGIIAKKADSIYHPAYRSKQWLKIKTSMRQEMLIIGYIPSDKNDREFRSLACGVWRNNKLFYTGRVGTGFSEALQKQILKRLKEIETETSEPMNAPSSKSITWVKPELICEVAFAEWTSDTIMRHPRFMGLREDKHVKNIKLQIPRLINPVKSRVKLSNPEKIFWPDEKITKQDVFDYYQEISHVIMPYLKNRPQSLYRTPDGITKKGFFQKNVAGIAPEWAETIHMEKDKEKSTRYLLCQDADTLLFMVNLGCIEMNPWNSSLPDLDLPDVMIFDLDPVDIGFEKVIEVANALHEILDKLKIPNYCKTSGSRGLHIYVPIIPRYTHKQVQNVVRTIQQFVHKTTNEITSFERSPEKRKGKIYLDYLQNGKGKTMSSVYSLRPREKAMVSAPLEWKEVNNNLSPADFNIHTMPERIAVTQLVQFS